jgi:predicted Zn-ribbon and HTH transcriptional regulator
LNKARAGRSEAQNREEKRTLTKKARPAPELEAEARAVNATNWQPLSGMTKKQCNECRHFFAMLIEEAETTSRCPDCASLGTG